MARKLLTLIFAALFMSGTAFADDSELVVNISHSSYSKIEMAVLYDGSIGNFDVIDQNPNISIEYREQDGFGDIGTIGVIEAYHLYVIAIQNKDGESPLPTGNILRIKTTAVAVIQRQWDWQGKEMAVDLNEDVMVYTKSSPAPNNFSGNTITMNKEDDVLGVEVYMYRSAEPANDDPLFTTQANWYVGKVGEGDVRVGQSLFPSKFSNLVTWGNMSGRSPVLEGSLPLPEGTGIMFIRRGTGVEVYHFTSSASATTVAVTPAENDIIIRGDDRVKSLDFYVIYTGGQINFPNPINPNVTVSPGSQWFGGFENERISFASDIGVMKIEVRSRDGRLQLPDGIIGRLTMSGGQILGVAQSINPGQEIPLQPGQNLVDWRHDDLANSPYQQGDHLVISEDDNVVGAVLYAYTDEHLSAKTKEFGGWQFTGNPFWSRYGWASLHGLMDRTSSPLTLDHALPTNTNGFVILRFSDGSYKSYLYENHGQESQLATTTAVEAMSWGQAKAQFGE